MSKKSSTGKYIVDIIRNEENKITSYKVTYFRRDKVPFVTELTRENVETIFGLYTYYGGNITARNVANEFPKFTLPEIKYILRAFQITKDSVWAPPHLVEELTIEELSQYRMNLKERAAFKYADAQQEKDFKNTLNKMASKILKLEDRNAFIENLIKEGVTYKERNVTEVVSHGTTGVLFISDLHVGAYNTPNGYLTLPEYSEEEINRRLDEIIDNIAHKRWDMLYVVNLGDSLDSYKKTTAKGTPLPSITTDKENVMMYLRVMGRFFDQLNKIFKVSYVCTGDSNHDGSYGWVANVALIPMLNNMDIETYVSNDPIDVLNIGDYSIVYLHGHDSSTQYKGFPLHLDDKTKNWFNNYFLQADKQFCKNRIVVKGDLHQFSIDCCNTFDYINAPSVYGSSAWITSNFGKGKNGAMYIEIQDNNYTTSVIWNR